MIVSAMLWVRLLLRRMPYCLQDKARRRDSHLTRNVSVYERYVGNKFNPLHHITRFPLPTLLYLRYIVKLIKHVKLF